jgi:plastocyanin
MWNRLLVPLAGLIVLSGCGPDPVTITPMTTAVVLDGNGQSALRGSPLPDPLRVRVEQDGIPVAGLAVTWEPSAGVITAASVATDSSGVAEAWWTLGSVPGALSVRAAVVGRDAPPAVFAATALPLISLRMDSTTDGQRGTAGQLLAEPLRVTVLAEGLPAAGAMVRWQAFSGSVPGSSESDAGGVATAPWTLGGLATDTNRVMAWVTGAEGPVWFTATSLAGPAARVVKHDGDGQALPANYPEFASLWALVTDTYGNVVPPGHLVTWTVEGGPAVLLLGNGTYTSVSSYTSPTGHVHVEIAPTGVSGSVTVRAELADGAASVAFTLTALPAEPLIVLDPERGFVSAQNGTCPAVDTIPAGATMTWLIHRFDGQSHTLVAAGLPSFDGGPFPLEAPSKLTVTFAEPGTYQYRDGRFDQLGTGTLVVR